jgi:erythromycin esterase
VRIPLVGLLILASTVGQAQARREAPDAAFVRWVAGVARPLDNGAMSETRENRDALERIVRGAQIVGVGESQHSMQELLSARYSLVRLLVSQLGFTAVAMETGLPEGRRIDAWVIGDSATEPRFANDVSYGFGRDVETIRLLRWLREYNAGVPHERRVHFYGVDLPRGGGGSLLPALEPVWAYLQKVDPAFTATNREQLQSIAQRVAGDGFFAAIPRYDSLGVGARDSLREGIVQLQRRLATHRPDYLQRASSDELTWAERLASVARQTESFLRATTSKSFSSSTNARDSAMASNALWVMERERSRGRVVLLAHNVHVGAQRPKGPFVAARAKALGDDGLVGTVDCTGFILRDRLGRGYANLGTAFSVGVIDSTEHTAESTSVDGILARVGPASFLLDLRNAPRAGPATWLDGERLMRIYDDYLEVVPRLSFDAILFVDRIHAATKAP